jgi:DNA-binding YbaB/EbfC family protein
MVMNPLKMMERAQQLSEQLQKELATVTIEGSAGAGMVTVVINGLKQVQQVKIDPEAVSKDDVEMLQAMIVSAVNVAMRRADEEMKNKVGGFMGGLNFPGLG